MAPRGNKYVKRATITEKKRRSWNVLKKLAIILYQEKVCSVRSAANKFHLRGLFKGGTTHPCQKYKYDTRYY